MSHPMNYGRVNQERRLRIAQMHACTNATIARKRLSKAELREMLTEAARNTAAISTDEADE